LALIIVLDQFSRSIHRGSARAYANDPKALALAHEGIEIGHAAAALKSPWEKIFFGLPLAHSEDLASQDLGVKLMEQLVSEAPPELRFILARFRRSKPEDIVTSSRGSVVIPIGTRC
jgi:uncharacterized protein (DUF924 family)